MRTDTNHLATPVPLDRPAHLPQLDLTGIAAEQLDIADTLTRLAAMAQGAATQPAGARHALIDWARHAVALLIAVDDPSWVDRCLAGFDLRPIEQTRGGRPKPAACIELAWRIGCSGSAVHALSALAELVAEESSDVIRPGR